MRLLKGGWAAKRFQGPTLPWAGLLLVLLAVSAVGESLLGSHSPACLLLVEVCLSLSRRDIPN